MMAIVRTKIILILFLVNFFVKNNCDSDVRQNNYGTDEVKLAEQLLRGGNDDRLGEEYVHIPNYRVNKNIEPEKYVFGENVDDEQKENKHYEKDYDETEMQRPVLEKNADINTKLTTTDTAPVNQGTTDASDEAADGPDKDSEVKNDDSDLSSSSLRHDDSDRRDDANESVVTSSAPLDATEAATDGYTLSMMDNNVYKHKDNTSEDIYTNGSGENNNSEIDSKVEHTTMSTTASSRTMDVVEPPAPPPTTDHVNVDPTGQRIPKTEQNNSKQPKDKRTNEVKQSLSPTISRSSTLKGWLEDVWLRPAPGILVPLRPMALSRALAVWNDLITTEGLNVSDIVIVGYDSNGVSWRSRHNLQGASSGHGNKAVSDALSKLLLKYQGVHSESSSDGTMRALASAAKLVPYDSALFVITDKGAGDPQKLPLALRALVEKRLKVYTIWTDANYPSTESETALQDLENVSRHTEGGILPYSVQVKDVEDLSNSAELQQWQPIEPMSQRQAKLYSQLTTNDYDVLLVRRGGGGAMSQGVPVENGVTALKIHIEGKVEHAVLYPPNEAPLIDLYNESSIKAFSPSSRTEGVSPRDILLIFPGSDPTGEPLAVLPVSKLQTDPPAATVGVWHLTVRCDTCEYRLSVGARSLIHFDTSLNKDKLELRVTGPVTSVRESLLVDEFGTELTKLPFSYQPVVANSPGNSPEDGQLEMDVPFPSNKAGKIYAKIFGRDIKGEPFTRLSGPIHQQSEVRMSRSAAIYDDLDIAEELNSIVYNSKLQYNDSNVLPTNRASSQIVNQQGTILTAVQIGLSTRLYGTPGANLQLHFEVTNYRNQAVSFNFGAVGELRFLRGISPTSQVIGSGQTANIIVSVGITTTAQPGARDLITFTAYSGNSEQVSISAYVYVVNSESSVTDVWAPEVRHNFQGTCIGRMGTDCATHVWSATVVARDAVGGLLRLSSSPVGLVYDSNFISGSREEVIASYRATCCAPRVMVTAVDAYGNANSYVIDISNYYSEAAIAAIVLGVLLAIALIALLVFLIYWCVKRRKESRELPYVTTSRSSRNIS